MAATSAVFFGLSGTGKTTLSADPDRILLGDDEHGWGPYGVFNFEGGCYAKTIRLSREAEPEIFATTERFGTVLENVVVDPITRDAGFRQCVARPRTRAAPIRSTSSPTRASPGARHSEEHRDADLRRLRRAAADRQADAGRGDVSLPVRLHGEGRRHREGRQGSGGDVLDLLRRALHAAPSSAYGNLLRDLIAKHHVDCWLVNTGWTGGQYGTGRRMPIRVTRRLLTAALDGSLSRADFRRDPYFGFAVPTSVPGVEPHILYPVKTWQDKAAFARRRSGWWRCSTRTSSASRPMWTRT